MKNIEIEFLKAINDMTQLKLELAPCIAEKLGCGIKQIFYIWNKREIEQEGNFLDWTYFFHGLECDLISNKDNRFIKIEFGPGGRVDTFTGWGAVQYIMASREPWPEYPELKKKLAAKKPPYDYFSGSHKKVVKLLKKLEKTKYVEVSDKALCVLVKESTIIDEEGYSFLNLPDDFSEVRITDSMVCHRLVISDKGRDVLKTLR